MTCPASGAPAPRPARRLQLAYRREPGYFVDLVHAHGRNVVAGFGPWRFALLSEPAAVQDVLVRQADAFVKGRRHARARRWFGQGLLLAEGAAHEAQRRLLQPAFHRDKLADYAPAMVAHSARLQARWQDGGRVDIAAEMFALAITVTADTLLGIDIGSRAAEVNAAVATLATVFRGGAGVRAVVAERLRWSPASNALAAAAALLDDLVDAMVAAKHARVGAAVDAHADADARIDVPTDAHADLLDHLLRHHPATPRADGRPAAPREVRDQVLTLLLAGRETLASSLIWTWYELGREPEVEANLHGELDRVLGARPATVLDVRRLPYTRQVFAETLRRHPPAWVISRRTVRACRVGEVDLPAGSVVLLSQFATHHDAGLFPDPWRFDPDRWAPDATSLRPPPGAFFPFGAGPRRCLGESFAWQMAILHVAIIARQWRLRPVSDRPVEIEATTSLQPKGGLWVRTERR